MTTTLGHHRGMTRTRERTRTGAHVGRIGLGAVAATLVLISALGAIIPYVGPVFGYSADGTGSWYWSSTHSVLALIPGVIGMLVGLSVLAASVGYRLGAAGSV